MHHTASTIKPSTVIRAKLTTVQTLLKDPTPEQTQQAVHTLREINDMLRENDNTLMGSLAPTQRQQIVRILESLPQVGRVFEQKRVEILIKHLQQHDA